MASWFRVVSVPPTIDDVVIVITSVFDTFLPSELGCREEVRDQVAARIRTPPLDQASM